MTMRLSRAATNNCRETPLSLRNPATTTSVSRTSRKDNDITCSMTNGPAMSFFSFNAESRGQSAIKRLQLIRWEAADVSRQPDVGQADQLGANDNEDSMS